MKFNSLTALALGFGLAFLTACGGEEPAQETPPVQDTTATAPVAQEVEEEEEIDLDDVELPTPLQMASILNRAGLTYQSGLTNDPMNGEKYATFYQKVANFGVYSGDLSYCALNNESQEALNYLQTINKISDDLGFSSVMNTQEMVSNFESSLDDKEALHGFIEDMEMNLEEYADMNETKYILPVLFAGGWIESMYLGTKSIQNESNEALQSQLIKQMMILDNLILGLKANPEKEDVINGMITSLEEIKMIFQGFDIIEKIDTDEPLTISAEEFAQLASKIEEVRNSIVTP